MTYVIRPSYQTPKSKIHTKLKSEVYADVKIAKHSLESNLVYLFIYLCIFNSVTYLIPAFSGAAASFDLLEHSICVFIHDVRHVDTGERKQLSHAFLLCSFPVCLPNVFYAATPIADVISLSLYKCKTSSTLIAISITYQHIYLSPYKRPSFSPSLKSSSNQET